MLAVAISEQLSGYGIAGAVMTSVMAVIVGPLIKAMIQQNKRSTDLMERAINQNSAVVEHLKGMEEGSVRSRQALAETQTEILASLRNLEHTLALRGLRNDNIQ